MSQNLRDLVRALYVFDAVVQRTPADKWDADSPCEGWTARDVLKHQCGVLDSLAEIVRTGEVVKPGTAEEANNPAERWAQSREGILQTLFEASADALSKEGKFWFGPMTIDQLVGMVVWDPLTHAWDIGTTAGVEPHLPEDLAKKSLTSAKSIEEMARKWNLIADATDVPADASAVDQYLAFVGRTP